MVTCAGIDRMVEMETINHMHILFTMKLQLSLNYGMVYNKNNEDKQF